MVRTTSWYGGLFAAILSVASTQASALTWTVESDQGGMLTTGGTSLHHWAESTSDFSLALNAVAGESNSSLSIHLGLMNTLAVTQTFTVTSTIPIKALSSPVDLAGSMGVTITDSSDPLDSAMLGIAGQDPFFQGLIDGVPIASATIFANPYFLSCTSGALLACTVADSGSFGPLVAAKNAMTSIGIRHTFTLTPGDSIGISSSLVVAGSPDPSINLPEPSMATLLASGLGILAMLGRQRR